MIWHLITYKGSYVMKPNKKSKKNCCMEAATGIGLYVNAQKTE